jgi:Ca2+/Na+ antiporter
VYRLVVGEVLASCMLQFVELPGSDFISRWTSLLNLSQSIIKSNKTLFISTCCSLITLFVCLLYKCEIFRMHLIVYLCFEV